MEGRLLPPPPPCTVDCCTIARKCRCRGDAAQYFYCMLKGLGRPGSILVLGRSCMACSAGCLHGVKGVWQLAASTASWERGSQKGTKEEAGRREGLRQEKREEERPGPVTLSVMAAWASSSGCLAGLLQEVLGGRGPPGALLGAGPCRHR